MPTMPLFFARLGVKWMLLVGMGAPVLRVASFSMAADDKVTWMIIVGILFLTAFVTTSSVTGINVHVDKEEPYNIALQAQGFLVLVTERYQVWEL